MKAQKYSMKRGLCTIGLLLIIVVTIAIVSMNSGKMNVSPIDVMRTLLGQGSRNQNLIVFEFRLPRIILAILVGIGMGVAGCIMQSLLKNDMASPGTLGISSGSGLFVLLYVVYLADRGRASSILLPVLAFVGGITAAILILVLSYRKGRDISPTNLILTGVALSSGYGAMTTLLTLKLEDYQMDFMQRWSAGSLWGDQWGFLMILAPWILVLVGYVFYKSRILNALNLGNQTATGLGVAVKREFIGLSIVSVAISSGSVALGGNFFFVGMISPHMAKKLVGPNHKFVIATSGLIGAILILLSDTLIRTISMGTDVPPGIVVTVLSTPYFLYLLAKSR